MYILTIYGKEDDGAYAVVSSKGEHILYIFEEEDDATRFAMMLEERDHPEMHVIEVDKETIITACEIHDYQYAIITANDIVIPPEQNDFI
jgi:hypothetical protein